jgi:hypothetical protein
MSSAIFFAVCVSYTALSCNYHNRVEGVATMYRASLLRLAWQFGGRGEWRNMCCGQRGQGFS